MTTELLEAARRAVRPAVMTALWTFTAMFGLTVTGWLADVAEWASTSGASPFPGLSVLGYGVVAAAAAAGSGLVAFVVRAAQAFTGTGKPPVYEP